jgi:Holliday junction resolvase RusA-like endonuclease
MVNKEEVETLEKAKEELQDILSDIDDLLERAYNGEELDKRDLDNILKRLEDVRDDLRELS